MRVLLRIFRLNVVFVHPLMQPVPCPIAPAQVSIIIVTLRAGMSLGELWCLSFSWLQGHTAQNCALLRIFSVKRRFRSSVDAAVPCPVAPAEV